MASEIEYNDLSHADLVRLISEKDETIQSQKFRINHLSFENEKLKSALFGKKSEKLSRGEENQQFFFNEIEINAPAENEIQKEKKSLIRFHLRKKTGRKPLSADHPRKVIVHDLDEENKFCKYGHALKHIGEDVSERLNIIPMQVNVERHIRHKYVCPVCSKNSKNNFQDENESEVKTAPGSPSLIPGSILTPGLFSYLITSKFCDAIPFYRMESIFKRFKIELNRATMCFWAIRIARDHRRLRKILFDELKKAHVIHLDESTLQVLKEKNRAATAISRMWTYRSTNENGTVVLYEYRTSREGKFLRKRLNGFRGVFVCDGYAGYNHIESIDNFIRAGCWAHVRRKFFESYSHDSPSQTVQSILDRIGNLYKIEDHCKDMAPASRKKYRQKYSKEIIEEIHALILENSILITTGSNLGKAIHYALEEWPRLLVFLSDGEVPIDNNRMENDIRPFAVGRKNWLFADTPKGASASAFYYSLIQTAKANGHDAFRYLYFLFEHLPGKSRDIEMLKKMLPMYVSPEQVDEYYFSKGIN